MRDGLRDDTPQAQNWRTVETKVKEIIAGILKVDIATVEDDCAVGDIPQWDSLHHMMIITDLQ